MCLHCGFSHTLGLAVRLRHEGFTQRCNRIADYKLVNNILAAHPILSRAKEQDPIRLAMDWLSAQPSADTAAEIIALCVHLQCLALPNILPAQYHRCLELFYARALRLGSDLRSNLRLASLPISHTHLSPGTQLCAALEKISEGFMRVLEASRGGSLRSRQDLPETLCAQALRMLIELFLITHQIGKDTPTGFWKAAYQFFQQSRTGSTAGKTESALLVYKTLLSLASLEPRSFSASELDWTAEYLSHAANQIQPQQEAPENALSGAWFWLDPTGDAEPRAWTRQAPPSKKSLLFFSTEPLARRASAVLAQTDNPDLKTSAQYPDILAGALLGRLREHWQTPAHRSQPRRAQRHAVHACIGLPAIWLLLRGGEDQGLITTWDVQNESPGGYAILQVEGQAKGISAGTAVALRDEGENVWQICVVRWLRSASPTAVELGLQIVSRGAVPVHVAFRSSGGSTPTLSNVLVLPVLPALRQHQAILAPAGTYTSRRFTLVSDVDRLYVAQARLLNLDMQTAQVELFQFEIDPYPL